MDFLLTFYKYVYSLGNYFSVLVVATCVVITIRTFACDYQWHNPNSIPNDIGTQVYPGGLFGCYYRPPCTISTQH